MAVGSIGVEIGGLPIRFISSDIGFFDLLKRNYVNFLSEPESPLIEIEVVIVKPPPAPIDSPLELRRLDDRWEIQRGDFIAFWDPALRKATLQQSLNLWSCDTALRVLYSLLLAE